MKINENTIIKCKSQAEISECLDMLKNLGFEILNDENNCGLFVAAFAGNIFTNFKTVKVNSEHNFISFKIFQKLYNKQIKDKELDLVVDKNGKVLKVNNWNSDKQLYWNDNIVTSPLNEWIKNSKNSFYKNDYYISKETCEKAIKRKETENKLRALAFELNENRDIDWDNEKPKYYLAYSNNSQTIIQDYFRNVQIQGTIYCYSFDFKDKAIELIGKEDLKDYLMNC